jgi:hypothetical protein
MFKFKRSVFVVLVLVVVVAMLAACGGDDKKSSSSSSNLSQSYTGAGGITVKYPDGWIAKDAAGDTIYVANNQAAMDAMEAATSGGPGKGQSAVVLMAMPLEALGGMSAADSFKAMVQSIGGEGSDTTLGDVKDVKVNGQTAYRADLTSPDGEGYYLGWESNGALIIAAGVAATGELKDMEATQLKIIDSVTYTAPAAG